jgi:hypothetical protein
MRPRCRDKDSNRVSRPDPFFARQRISLDSC